MGQIFVIVMENNDWNIRGGYATHVEPLTDLFV